MNMDFPNTEIWESECGRGGGMVGEYRNKKRLATPSNATTSKYTNASCQQLQNTPLHPSLNTAMQSTTDHENTH